MDYEKKYKEAIKKAEEIIKYYKERNRDEAAIEDLKGIFPELKESEDERIRKALKEYFINSFQNNGVAAILGVHIKDILAWLEKQGEQKPFDYENANIQQKDYAPKVEPKFRNGVWVTNSIETLQITGYDIDYGYQVDYKGNLQHRDTDIVEKEYHIWTIQDAKDGDVLCLYYNNRKTFFIFKAIIGEGGYADILVHCCYRGKYQYLEPSFNGECRMHQISDGGYCLPADKEEQDILFQKMKEAGYKWDAEKKELKKIEQSIEIPFGAKDSELQEASYYIPKGYHAEIDGDKVVIKKGEQKPAWKPADGDDIPKYDREVIVLYQPSNLELEKTEYCVSFAHRPNPDGWDGKSVLTGKVEHYIPKTNGKGGWNIPDVIWWLDADLPNTEE